MGAGFCVVAFVAAWLLGRRSLSAGLGGVLTAGYLYGIVRANYLDSFTHFIFDSAVAGFYLAMLMNPPPTARDSRLAPLQGWLKLLLGWSCIMFLLPLQHPLIQLVGLRGNGFLLPFLLIGGWLQREDAVRLALWLAVLNLLALVFAVAQYFVGVEPFFPVNAVTEIIYKSGDVAGFSAYRIPACFANAHSYGGAMVFSLPWLFGAWMQPDAGPRRRGLLLAGMSAAVLGVFLCASRTHVLLLAVLAIAVACSGALRARHVVPLLLALVVIGFVVSGEERLQRFVTLLDSESVVERIEGSVNLSFFELALSYPMGNGMGAGGTSIPFFLIGLLQNPIGLENEYGRLLLELGLPGLFLWLAFILWIARQWPPRTDDSWWLGRRLLWCLSLACFANGLMGIGMMTAIPQSTLLFVGIGFLTTPAPMGRSAVAGRSSTTQVARGRRHALADAVA
jgi:hypothetical protein